MNAPITWDHETAVKRMRAALEVMGGKDGLRASVDVRARSVMVDNYAHALKHDLYPDQVKALIDIQAHEDSECWEAMISIESMALSCEMAEAERHVKRTIGNCPGKRKGRDSSTNMPRNEFIHDGIEVLQDAGNMQLKDAIDVMAEVVFGNEYKGRKDITIKARQTYIRTMERNRQLWRVACYNAAIQELLEESKPCQGYLRMVDWNCELHSLISFMTYKYVYDRLSLPECLPAGRTRFTRP